MLKDAVNGYNGQDSNDVMQARQFLTQRQMMNSLMGAMNPQAPGGGDLVGNPGGGSPGVAPINPQALRMLALMNPQAARALVEQQKVQGETYVGPDGVVRLKYDPSTVGQRITTPQAVNNTIVDMSDPGNTNRVIPSAPVPGAMPKYDSRGQVVDWTLPPGAQQAIIASQAPQIAHNQAMERIGSYEAGTGRMNAGTQAAAQANTQSQNVVALPPGFVVRPRKR